MFDSLVLLTLLSRLVQTPFPVIGYEQGSASLSLQLLLAQTRSLGFLYPAEEINTTSSFPPSSTQSRVDKVSHNQHAMEAVQKLIAFSSPWSV